jgi:DNA-binding PadR family transcriptional regulator
LRSQLTAAADRRTVAPSHLAPSHPTVAPWHRRTLAPFTGGTFVVQPGSLFPALHRLEEAGWLSATWDASENNRRAKFYALTRAGKRQLGEETAQWNRVALAIARALET